MLVALQNHVHSTGRQGQDARLLVVHVALSLVPFFAVATQHLLLWTSQQAALRKV